MLSVCKQPNEQRGVFCLSHKYKVKLVGNRLILVFTTKIYRSSLKFQLNKKKLEHFPLMFCSVKKIIIIVIIIIIIIIITIIIKLIIIIIIITIFIVVGYIRNGWLYQTYNNIVNLDSKYLTL